MQLSGLASRVKRALVEQEGKVTRSEFYLTNLDSGEEVRLSMPPSEVKVKTSANFRSWNIVEVGEVKLPKGEKLTQISWRGVLPGARMLLAPFIVHEAWEQPAELIKVFKRWREDGAKLKLLVTQTPINMDVYLRSFDWEATGGQGNYDYTIELIAAKELQVMTVAEADAKRDAASRENELKSRAANKSRLASRLAKIDTIWSITKILSGNGTLADVEKILERNGKSLDDLDEGDLLIWG